MMGTPAEEFLVTGSLVFSLISISPLQYGENTKYLLTLTNGPEVVQIIRVMSIHNGITCRRMLSQRFLGIFTNIHLPPPVWRKYKSIY
jgi:hypothetical protein